MGNIDIYVSYLGVHKLEDNVAILPLIFFEALLSCTTKVYSFIPIVVCRVSISPHTLLLSYYLSFGHGFLGGWAESFIVKILISMIISIFIAYSM